MCKYTKYFILPVAALALTLGGTAMAGSNSDINEALYSETEFGHFGIAKENAGQFADNYQRLVSESQLSSTTRSVNSDSWQTVPSNEPDHDMEQLYRD